MYNYHRPIKKSVITCNESYEGESLEREIEKATSQKQPIQSISPIIYTARKDGVRPEYDIRTDRFEIAQDSMGKVSDHYRAIRDNVPNISAEPSPQP